MSLIYLYLAQDLLYACSEINFFDRKEGWTVSYSLCDHWWHLNIVLLKRHRGWSSVKIEDCIVQLENLHKTGGSSLS